MCVCCASIHEFFPSILISFAICYLNGSWQLLPMRWTKAFVIVLHAKRFPSWLLNIILFFLSRHFFFFFGLLSNERPQCKLQSKRSVSHTCNRICLRVTFIVYFFYFFSFFFVHTKRVVVGAYNACYCLGQSM